MTHTVLFTSLSRILSEMKLSTHRNTVGLSRTKTISSRESWFGEFCPQTLCTQPLIKTDAKNIYLKKFIFLFQHRPTVNRPLFRIVDITSGGSWRQLILIRTGRRF